MKMLVKTNLIHSKNILFLFTLILLLAFFQISCNKKNLGEITTPTTEGDDTSGDIQPSDSYLWLHHKAVSGALRYTHKAVTTGTWPDLCKVDLDATSASERDIMCVTESTELDLMHIGMNLEYNVPAHEKCSYIITMAPYFFQFEPPRNDTGFPSLTESPHLEPANVTVVDNQVTGSWSATATYADGTTANPYLVADSGSFYCAFNHGAKKTGWPNCCQGKYNLRTTTTTTDGTSIVQSVGDWGGLRADCLNGPATELNPKSEDNFPIPLIWRGKEQITFYTLSNTPETSVFPEELFKVFQNDFKALESEKKNFGNLEIGSLFEKKYGTTRYIANYLPSTTPRSFQDIIDHYSWDYPPGYNYLTNYMDPRYYTVLCTDSAQEVTARIRLKVREWNTLSALKLATEPTSNEDDSAGNESDFPEFPNHDFYDWEDTSGLIRWDETTSATAGYPGTSL